MQQVSIDWLTATMQWNKTDDDSDGEKQARKMLDALPGNGSREEVSPYPRNYTRAIAGHYGKVSWHPEHPQMRMCLNLTGDDCRIAYQQIDLSQLVALTYSAGARITRVDIAVDSFEEYDLGDVKQRAIDYPEEFTVKTVTPYQHIDVGGDAGKAIDTGLYLGSRSSDRFICVYDKAIERGLDMSWLRVEIRNRREQAMRIGEALTQNPIDAVTRTAIGELARPNIDWWVEMMAGEMVEIPTIGRKQTDTRAWLIDMVLPVLADELALVDDPRDPLFTRYSDLLNKHRWRLQSKAG